MSKKPTLFALMVGIDEYMVGTRVPSLGGCKNDIQKTKKILKEKYADELIFRDEGEENPTFKTLINEAAKYNEVVSWFGHFANRADLKTDDIFLFVYSGHGSRERQAKKFDKIFPEGWSETLVCYDSRSENGLDLADKELAVLFSRIGENCNNITTIIDCCHSGSVVRDMSEFVGPMRRLNERTKKRRSYETYLDGYYSKKYPKDDEDIIVEIPTTKMVSLTACNHLEKARELSRYQRGAFSYFLGKALQDHKDEALSYNELVETVRSNIRTKLTTQTPQVETYEYFNPNTSFLTNKNAGESNYKVSKNVDGHWEINIGAQRGLPLVLHKDANNKKLKLKLKVLDGGVEVGTATIKRKKIFLERSFVKLDFNPKKEKYDAQFLSPPVPPYPILRVDINEAGKACLQTAMEKRGSIHFELLYDIYNPKYALKVSDKTKGEKRKISAEIRNLSNDSLIVKYYGDDEQTIFDNIFEALETIANWEKKLAIENPKPILNPDDVEIVFKDKRPGGKEYTENLVTLETVMDDENYQKIPFEIIARNKVDYSKPLNFNMAYFSPRFRVMALGNEKKSIPSGKKAVLYSSRLKLPTEKVEATDIFKVFISTGDFHTNLIVQDKVKNFGLSKACRIGGKFRDLEEDEDVPREVVQDWFTKTIRVRTIGKANSIKSDEDLKIGDGITIHKHDALQGNVSLVVTESDSRSLDEFSIVSQLVKQFEGAEWLSLDSERSTFGKPNAIEISDIEHDDALAEKSLTVSLEIALQEDEILLPLTYDGEQILPLELKTEGNKHRVELKELKGVSQDRSIGKAFRLFFMKIKGIREEKYRLLRWVDYSEGKIKRKKARLADKVDKANNMLLCIHGIIGDTKVMAEFAGSLCKQVQEDAPFDLVLTFDYENLSSKIDTTAESLKEQLKEAGIDKNPGKKLTILAQSMGGLVARYFIEKGNGHELVDRLVMTGTPNKGSVLAELADNLFAKWLPVLLFIVNVARNPLALRDIFRLLLGKYNINGSLGQLQWEHEDKWLKSLYDSRDPEIPYEIVAGNLENYLEISDVKKKLKEKIMKLGGELFYPDEENDLAVSHDSIWGVKSDRKYPPKLHEVDCFHMGYYDVEESVEKLKNILCKP